MLPVPAGLVQRINNGWWCLDRTQQAGLHAAARSAPWRGSWRQIAGAICHFFQHCASKGGWEQLVPLTSSPGDRRSCLQNGRACWSSLQGASVPRSSLMDPLAPISSLRRFKTSIPLAWMTFHPFGFLASLPFGVVDFLSLWVDGFPSPWDGYLSNLLVLMAFHPLELMAFHPFGVMIFHPFGLMAFHPWETYSSIFWTSSSPSDQPRNSSCLGVRPEQS